MANIIYYAKIGGLKREFPKDLDGQTLQAWAQKQLESARDAELFAGLSDFPIPATGMASDLEIFDEAPKAYAVEDEETGEYACFEDPLADYRCGSEPASFEEALRAAHAIRVGNGALLEGWETEEGMLVIDESDYDGEITSHEIPLEGARKIGAFTWETADGTLVDLYRFEPVRIGGAA